MNWVPIYALILVGVTLITFAFALIIEKKKAWGHKKYIIYSGILLTLLPLLIFKYYNFINNIIANGLKFFGLNFSLEGLNLAIPIGISFFTFQALGYLWDVYYSKIKAEKSILDYALFISFFPQIASGPINKAQLLLPQIKKQRSFDYNQIVEGFKFLLWGMFMKVVVADRLGLYVEAVYSNYEYQSGISCFIASILYSVQIYGDFGGYSLMAIGVGQILGFNLTTNFIRPYFSTSVTDFWRRWHISLSTWLKDYIYIPLGGSRCNKFRNYWNIFFTFLISGIWHGANWTYIVWGLFHGLFQIIEKILNIQKCQQDGWIKGSRIFITFLLVNFAWIFFRMPSLSDSCNIICKIFTDFGNMHVYLPEKSNTVFIILGLMLLSIKEILDEFYPSKMLLFNNSNVVIRWSSYIIIFIIIMLTGVFDAGQFIYVNF